MPEPLALYHGSFPCRVLEATPGRPLGSAACNATCAPPVRKVASPAEYDSLATDPDYRQSCMTLPDGGPTDDSCCVCEIEQIPDTLDAGQWDQTQCTTLTPDEPLHACQCQSGTTGP